jgi:hypothetical protein
MAIAKYRTRRFSRSDDNNFSPNFANFLLQMKSLEKKFTLKSVCSKLKALMFSYYLIS